MNDREPEPTVMAVEELAVDEILVTAGSPPGPAGLATVSLLDDAATLAVDTAEPDAVVSLTLPEPVDGRTLRLAMAVLDPTTVDALGGWLAGPSPRRPGRLDTGTPQAGSGVAGRIGSQLALFGRLAVGLDELVRPDLSDVALAVSLVDLGALAFDLSDLGPSPDGAVLVDAGLDRWEDLEPDEWDDDGEALLAATLRKVPLWTKSVWRRADLADRLEALAGALRQRRTGPRFVAASAAPTVFSMRPGVARAAAMGPAPAGGEASAAPPRPVVDVAFDADLEGRMIAADRDGHHLTVHLGGLDDDDLWLRVFEAGAVPRLLALAPVGAPERTWRTAVAVIGPDVADHDLLADVTRRPREPFRAPAVRRTERATHLGRAAARAGRTRSTSGSGGDERDAWAECAAAWARAGDTIRADRALGYAERPPVPRWADTDPLLSDLADPI